MGKLDYEYKVIRDAAELTNVYVSSVIRGLNDNLELTGKNQLILYIDLTLGSLDTVEMQIEFSYNGIDYYKESVIELSESIGTVTEFEYVFNTTDKYRIAVPLKDRFIKVNIKGTGDTTGSSAQIVSITGIS